MYGIKNRNRIVMKKMKKHANKGKHNGKVQEKDVSKEKERKGKKEGEQQRKTFI